MAKKGSEFSAGIVAVGADCGGRLVVTHVSTPGGKVYVSSADLHTFNLVRVSDGMPLQQMTDSTAANTRADAIDAGNEGV
jgi:hypothetical protein